MVLMGVGAEVGRDEGVGVVRKVFMAPMFRPSVGVVGNDAVGAP